LRPDWMSSRNSDRFKIRSSFLKEKRIMMHYSLSIIHCAWLIIETDSQDISTGQPGPALCPAPINNSATCFRRHPFAKSMIPGPLYPAGLKSALHFISPLFYYKF
jgi:hypothetical protein